jgi:alpha-mannosidase
MATVYLVPHTHYDVAWAFSKEEYLKINEAILEQALALMKAPEFRFCLEQTFLLKEMETRNPDLFKGIKKMIKAGKLEIVDGQYLMADTMLPNGEVLLRDIMVGKRYCQEKFGVDVPVAWAADSFGMNAQLPQIYKKAGYQWLAFRRGARPDIRESEFRWRGLDGTTIMAHWFPLGYRAGLNIDQWPESLAKLKKYACTPNILMPCGSSSSRWSSATKSPR